MATHIALQLSYESGAALNITGGLSEAASDLAEQLVTQIRADQEQAKATP